MGETKANFEIEAEKWANKGARCLSELKFDEAIALYTRAIQNNPNNADYYNSRGISLSKIERFYEAIEEFNRAIQMNPNVANYYYNRGFSFHEEERYEDAINDFERAILRDPHKAQYYTGKGNSLFRLEKYEEAIDEYNMAILIDGAVKIRYNNKKYALKMLGRNEEVKMVDVDYMINFGSHLFDEEKFEEAKKELENSLQLIERYQKDCPNYLREIYHEKKKINLQKLSECQREIDLIEEIEEEKKLQRLINAQLQRNIKERLFFDQTQELFDQLNQCIHNSNIVDKDMKNNSFITNFNQFSSIIEKISNDRNSLLLVYQLELIELKDWFLSIYKIINYIRMTSFERAAFNAKFQKLFKCDPESYVPFSYRFSNRYCSNLFINIFYYLLPHIWTVISNLLFNVNPNNNININKNDEIIIQYIKYFEKYLKDMNDKYYYAGKEVDNVFLPQPIICESSIGYKELNEQSAEILIPIGNGLKKNNQQGHHIVLSHHKIHFKCIRSSNEDVGEIVTASHGMEVIVHCLHNAVAGIGSTPTTLVKVMRGKEFNIFQASKTVFGADLQYILEKKFHLIPLIDIDNFSAMIVLSILTNPQDGKADNFMVEIESEVNSSSNLNNNIINNNSNSNSNNNVGEDSYYIGGVEKFAKIKKLHIIGIDNDMAFGEEFTRRRVNNIEEEIINVRNLLYFFPQMDQQIGSGFREQFLNKQPEMILIDFLYNLHLKNQGFEELISIEIFTKIDCEGNPKIPNDRGLDIPIKLPKRIISRLYYLLYDIRNFLITRSDATHRDLLSHIQPKVESFYRKTQQLLRSKSSLNNNNDINNLNNKSNSNNNSEDKNDINKVNNNNNNGEQDLSQFVNILDCIESIYYATLDIHPSVPSNYYSKCQSDTNINYNSLIINNQQISPEGMAIVRRRREFHNSASVLLSKQTLALKRELTVSQSAFELMKLIDFKVFEEKSKLAKTNENFIISEIFHKFSSFSEEMIIRGSSIDSIRLLEYLKNCQSLKRLFLFNCDNIAFNHLPTILRSLKNLSITIDLYPYIHFSLLRKNLPNLLTPSGDEVDNNNNNDNNNDNNSISLAKSKFFQLFENIDLLIIINQLIRAHRLIFTIGEDQLQFNHQSLGDYYSELLYNILIIILKSPFDYSVELIIELFDLLINNAKANLNYHYLRSYQSLHLFCKYFPHRYKEEPNNNNNNDDDNLNNNNYKNYKKNSRIKSNDYSKRNNQSLFDNSDLYNNEEKEWARKMMEYLLVIRDAQRDGVDEADETPIQKAYKNNNYLLVHLFNSIRRL